MPESIQVQHGFAKVNGAKLYYEIAGEGHPLVLIHGGLMDNTMWDDQFSVFARHYRVLRYDMLSFGQSDIPTLEKPISLYEDLYGLLAFLGIDKTYVLGLSMGGSTALDFTLAHPHMVDALVLCAPGVSGYQSQPTEAEQATWNEIEEAIKRADFERVTELETRVWVDGPERAPEQVDAVVRQRVYDMNLPQLSTPGEH